MDAARTKGNAEVTLLYVRPEGDGQTGLDRVVELVAGRYGVTLQVVPPDREPAVPALLVLRGEEIVGQAMGALLPVRDLDDVVRRAVEWPVRAAS
jgi:hypothetical protein